MRRPVAGLSATERVVSAGHHAACVCGREDAGLCGPETFGAVSDALLLHNGLPQPLCTDGGTCVCVSGESSVCGCGYALVWLCRQESSVRVQQGSEHVQNALPR